MRGEGGPGDGAPPEAEDPRPPFGAGEAKRLLAEAYGLEAREVEPLPGYQDRNFRVRTSAGERLVLKVAAATEAREALEAQAEALERLAAASLPCRVPEPLRTREGEALAWTRDPEGRRYAVRAVRHIPGTPMAEVRPHPPSLLRELGTALGAVDAALEEMEHPGVRRELEWELGRGWEVLRRGLAGIEKGALPVPAHRRPLLERTRDLYRERVAPLEGELRRQVIHGDANDHNVLVTPLGPEADPFTERHVVGLIDFGDLSRSWVVAEPAIAAAYALLGKAAPLEAAARVAEGFHLRHPLTEAELRALFPLVCLRLSVSVVLAARRRAQASRNPYLAVSEAPAWEALERLARVDPDLAHYTLRGACGLEPCPASPPLVRWLGERTGRLPPLVEPPTGAAAGSHLLLAPYGEVRRPDPGGGGRKETERGPEVPTIHLGIDLIVPPGTPVRTPLPGTVHAALPQGEGAPGEALEPGRGEGPGVLVLELRPGERIPPFHLLLGGLAPDSIRDLPPGDAVAEGAEVGRVAGGAGAADGTSHLHVQVSAHPPPPGRGLPPAARPGESDVWRSVCPNPAPLLGLPGSAATAGRPDRNALLERRRRLLGPALSLSYRRPLHIVRGWMAHLYDAEGRVYLDGVNNIAHVGHAHPRVVRAIHGQASVLNTNTRYLHETVLLLAERLTATLPAPLSVCHFVCSGSEANELALRMARAHTGARGVVAVEGGYHGNTSTLVEISPYKFDGPGGSGAPPWVRTAPVPDPYRGRHRASQPDAGRRYGEAVGDAARALHEAGHGVAAFFSEPLQSCAGQIEPPPGYLAEAYRRIREAGGVCVADEVQVGFGRLGEPFWGFQTQEVVPDVVTMGKPMGNGHPVAAVVTTPEIAASFDTGMEFFSSFGGNPVSCAAALAVLDVLEEEAVPERAARVGGHLTTRLRELAGHHPVIGDVRGRGLFLGVELVRDPEARTPAGRLAAYVAERMREIGVLTSTDGPDGNVLKIKPPLAFRRADADRFADALEAVLEEDPVRVVEAGGG